MLVADISKNSNMQWTRSQHKHVDKSGTQCTSTCNNSHIYSGFTTTSFCSSVGGGLPRGHSVQTTKKKGNNKNKKKRIINDPLPTDGIEMTPYFAIATHCGPLSFQAEKQSSFCYAFSVFAC